MDEVISFQLRYGYEGAFAGDVLRKRLLLHHPAAESSADAEAQARAALAHPLDLPDLRRAFVPGDHVVVALAADTPAAEAVIAELWLLLEQSGVTPDSMTLLQPATWEQTGHGDPRRSLPDDIREQMPWLRHDPTDEANCTYLASTASGERIYLSRELVDADVVICVGPAQFDPVLGYRGTASSLYPGMSDMETILRAVGEGHDELGPHDPRPLRQIVDEVGWLLGVQLAINVIPGVAGGLRAVFAGQAEAVMARSREILDAEWKVELQERAELVLVSVDADAAGHGWGQIAAAIDCARRLVERDGRIVVLTELAMTPGPGLEILRQSRTPRDAFKPIQQAVPPDLVAAMRIAKGVDWANVSLLSKLPPDLVEDLFMVPLESEAEVQRLLHGDETTAIIESGQQTYSVCQ